jgi:hypothetical protein
VNCVRDEQLHEYIVEKTFGDKLRADEAEQIAQAFLAVARMDKDFGRESQPASKSDDLVKPKSARTAKEAREHRAN